MNLQGAKLELMKLIISINDESVIEKMLAALRSGSDDFYIQLTDSQREEIQIGIKQLDTGNRTSLEDFLKKVS